MRGKNIRSNESKKQAIKYKNKICMSKDHLSGIYSNLEEAIK
jgi:hypothetical protein